MKIFIPILLIIGLVSCTPRLHYLGDSYTYNENVDVFYDEADIDRDYKVMGQLSSDNSEIPFALDKMKESMITMAKEKGADAILFLFHDSYNDNHRIESKLLKYR